MGFFKGLFFNLILNNLSDLINHLWSESEKQAVKSVKVIEKADKEVAVIKQKMVEVNRKAVVQAEDLHQKAEMAKKLSGAITEALK